MAFGLDAYSPSLNSILFVRSRFRWQRDPLFGVIILFFGRLGWHRFFAHVSICR